MNELSPEDAESIIEAAARGESVVGHGQLAEVLTALHAPIAAAPGAAAPTPATAGGDGVTRRIARRTAVAASVAVLSLAGVAAAATGTLPLLEPPKVDDVGEVAEADAESTDVDSGAAAESDHPDGDAEAVDEGTEEPGRHDEIEGVDPTDGLDAEELELLCEAAVNHGHYVSNVAGDRQTEHDGTHGSRVSEAAESDCGKDDDEEPTDVDELEEAAELEESDELEETDELDDDAGPGNGHGASNGKGHDNGDDHPGQRNGHNKEQASGSDG